jgi:transposase
MHNSPNESSEIDFQEHHQARDCDFEPCRREALMALTAITPTPGTKPRRLRIEQLNRAPEVFSFRQPIENDYTQRATIDELARDLKKGQRLDPIRVVWTARGWTVTDGYLRLEAYKVAEWDAGIPVTVFNGTPEEALDKAVESNRKRTLPLTQAERADVAWFYISSDRNLSQREIAQQSGVSRRMVPYMRKTKRMLEEKGLDPEAYSTWSKARMAQLSEEEVEEFCEDREVKRIHMILRTTFGQLQYHSVNTFAAGVKKFTGRRFEEFVTALGELGGAEAYEAGCKEALYYAENPDF